MFHDRHDAGRLIADRLSRYRAQPNVLVLGLARGGVSVARVVADTIDAPLDVFIVRKLSAPWQPELGFGAIAENSPPMIDDEMVEYYRIDLETIRNVVKQERLEIERRVQLYRGGRPMTNVRNRIVIVVDDGIATGVSMLAAVRELRQRQARRIVVAVPVGSQSAYRDLQAEADEVVCLLFPSQFHSVSTSYENFAQLEDRQVLEELSGARSGNRHRAQVRA